MDTGVGHRIPDIVRRRLGVRESVAALVQSLAEETPTPAWEKILALDFDADTAALVEWFEQLLAAEPPAPEINALWFGLFSRALDDGSSASALYAAGSERYGRDREWMVSPEWWPRRRYAPSTVQRVLRSICYADGKRVGWLADYAVTLTHAASSVNALIDAVGPSRILGDRASLAITVGHDSGDALLLGVLRSAGLDDSDFGWV
jgi:hypothetical protein